MNQPGRVYLEQKGAVAWITIDNLAKRNAMSLHMWRALDEALAGVTNETRCVVLRGAGDKAFVSGADISEFADSRRAPEDVAAYDRVADAAMDRLYSLPQPTIAMISGFCFGAGVALSLCCDLRFAAENSLFSVPAARLGLGYGAAGLKKLLDVVSVPVATDIMVSARRFDTEEALRMGVLNQVYPAQQLQAETEAYAGVIARNAPLTVKAAKRTIKELSVVNPVADLDLCRRLVAECFASEDYVEGPRAFLEKREPRFVGR